MSDYGMPTLIEAPGPLESASLCAALGLSFVELNLNLPQYQPGRLDVSALLSAQERYGVYHTIHLEEGLDVCDFNPHVAEAYRRTVREAAALAKTLRESLRFLNARRQGGG